MIPRACKRLAEVDFPIADVSKHAVQEQKIGHTHPSALHLWWARRPLASSRAILLALLLPDPCDENCPEDFRTKAREILKPVPGDVGITNEDLRKALLRFIGDFADWDYATSTTFLEAGRALVKAAHPNETPLIVDPFAGGGSIPLEALRLGCDAFASDLNPVACLILNATLKNLSGQRLRLSEDLRRLGSSIKDQAGRELADLYPTDPDGARPITYLWARTVRCEAPNCGAEIPLIRSFWLCNKAKRRRALRHRIERSAGEPPRIEFEIFIPKAQTDVPGGTVTRAKATCICCGTVLPPERVRLQLSAQRGGADAVFDTGGHRIGGARLLAVVSLVPGETGRNYRLPVDRDYMGIRRAQERAVEILSRFEQNTNNSLCPLPDERLPPSNTNCFRVPNYGVKEWRDLFNARQLVTAYAFASRIHDLAFEDVNLQHLVALCLDKSIDLGNSFARWKLDAECPVNLFTHQAISMVWDYAETVVTESSSGSFDSSVERSAQTLSRCYFPPASSSEIQLSDAKNSPLPDASCQVWFTDPPYYDAIGYAELSDFFFVWLKRALPTCTLLQDPFDRGNMLTPKRQECVQDEQYVAENGQPKTRAFFENAVAQAFSEGRRVLADDGIGSVVFAHKTTEGWEALLSGITRGGWVITGSWPVATEMAARLRARDSAALATSVHLICRPRTEARTGDWADVLRELPERVGEWMVRLDREGVRGADLVFACIGPALEIFSRYSRVETADGREVQLPEYLEKVWEVVGREALHQVLGTAEAQARNGGAGALEEDARLTALFLWTIRSTAGASAEAEGTRDGAAGEDEEEAEEADDGDGGATRKVKGFSLIYDIVRRFAQPLGIHLSDWEGRIIATEKGVVRLLPVAERAPALRRRWRSWACGPHRASADDGAPARTVSRSA
jgi:putative DNA methylase